MFQPVHHAPAVCILYLVMYQEKGETRQNKGDALWFSELNTKAVSPSPHPSIHPCPFLIYVMFSLPFLWALFLRAWSNNLVMNIRGWAASSHVLEARAHASRAAASKPVPENGLPEWQQNWKLLKYLNIRSLWGLPCNYTCSYHISTNTCACTCVTDKCCMWVHM